MRQFFIILISFITGSGLLYGQHFSLPTEAGEKQSLQDLQLKFEQYQQNNDIASTKGWKWFKRWEEHWSQRTTLGNDMPNTDIFIDEAIKAQASTWQKDGQDEELWYPIGPNNLPESPNQYSSHGMARLNCIEFHPTDPNTYWIGASQGGVWKTTNAGESWTPLNNGFPILRISDIKVDPNNTDILYACVGDFEYNGVALNTDGRKRHTHYGVGIYKTIDGGLTWNPTGLTTQMEDLDASLLRGLVISPLNTSVLVAGGFEGIWKSVNGGQDWDNVLEDVIVSDIEIDPNNPNTIYVGSTYVSTLDEGYAGVLKSIDFGTTWTVLESTIPPQIGRRVEVAVSPSNADYIYALVSGLDSGLQGIYKSEDAGSTWSIQSSGEDRNILAWGDGLGEIGGQGWYDLTLVVDPGNPNKIYAGGVNAWGSVDGGITWDGISYWLPYYGKSLHADQHQFKFNPIDNQFYVCNDGGLFRTFNLLIGSWDEVNTNNDYEWPTEWDFISNGMQVTSFYRLGLSRNNPGAVIAGAQDNSTFFFNGTEWLNIIGGDGMECILHPDDVDQLWGSSQYGHISRSSNGGYNIQGGLGQLMLSEEQASWTTPFLFHESTSTLYAGYGNLWKSINNGNTWEKLSDMPLLEDTWFPAPASALAVSKNNAGSIYMAKRIYHAYNEPSVLWITENEGESWQDKTNGLPDSLYFTYIAVHPDNGQRAWVTCSGFDLGNKVFTTNDAGNTWENISYDLPNIPINSIALDEESPEGTIYIGTDLGVFAKDEDSDSWLRYGAELPNVIVSEIEVDYNERNLVIATFGRGLWNVSLPDVVETSLHEAQNQVTVQVLPNINNGQFRLSVHSSDTGNMMVQVIDITGRIIISEKIEKRSIDFGKTMNLPLLPGIYYVQVKMNGETFTQKMMVQ